MKPARKAELIGVLLIIVAAGPIAYSLEFGAPPLLVLLSVVAGASGFFIFLAGRFME